MSATGRTTHRTRHVGRGTGAWTRLTSADGELTPHGEHTAEMAEQEFAGYWDPPVQFDPPSPTGHGWAPEPYGDGCVV